MMQARYLDALSLSVSLIKPPKRSLNKLRGSGYKFSINIERSRPWQDCMSALGHSLRGCLTRRPLLSVVSPIADKRERGWIVR